MSSLLLTCNALYLFQLFLTVFLVRMLLSLLPSLSSSFFFLGVEGEQHYFHLSKSFFLVQLLYSAEVWKMNQNEVKWEDTPNCCPIPWEIFLSIHIKSRGTRILPWHWCRLLNLLQHLITLSVEKHTDFHVIFDLQWREIKSFFFCLRTFTVAPTSPALTSQPWRNLEAIPPLRRSGSLLTRSITLCLFQLKLTPFAVKSMAIPCRKVTHPCNTRCPGGFSVSGCILCCYIPTSVLLL